jgi:hypothetical protein
MRALNAYRSACDQHVQLMLTDEPAQDRPSPIHDGELACLDIGQHCTGALCPMGAVSSSDMAARLARNAESFAGSQKSGPRKLH